MIENCSNLLLTIKSHIIQHIKILVKPNAMRTLHSTLTDFMEFLFSKFNAVETVFRHECQSLWQSLVVKLPQTKKTAPNEIIKTYIKAHYVPKQGEKNIHLNFQLIDFSDLKKHKTQSKKLLHEQRKAYLLDTQKMLD